jgi:hypothetical protein
MEKIVGGLIGFLLYIGTILTTFGLLGVLPFVLLGLAIEYCRTRRNSRALRIALCFPAAYVIGGYIGWIFRPYHWSMSFMDTLRAQTADHSIEYYAERVLLTVLMTGSIGVWMAGISMAVWAKRQTRRSLG